MRSLPTGADIDEADWIAISGLEHWSYCPRQYALIHVEATYEENAFTMRGCYTHERIHDEGAAHSASMLVERNLPVCSRRLGLTGKTDLVEYPGGVPYPVEYKSGPDVEAPHANIQVCAQAMCLEEMTGLMVPHGAVFYFGSRRRREVRLDDELRRAVEGAVTAIRAFDWAGPLPPPLADARCRSCSLADACLPQVVKRPRRLVRAAIELFDTNGES